MHKQLLIRNLMLKYLLIIGVSFLDTKEIADITQFNSPNGTRYKIIYKDRSQESIQLCPTEYIHIKLNKYLQLEEMKEYTLTDGHGIFEDFKARHQNFKK